MDASGNVPGTAQQQQQQQLASMIRPEQVKRLPHLNDEKKQQHEVYIQRLWDNLRSNPQGSPEYQKALASLANISTSLMAGMKRFTAQRHQQQQQGLIAQQQAPSASNETDSLRSAGLGIQATQILPHIQAKVNNYPFSLPPTMPEASAQAETWLREARNRLAQAMQRAEYAQKKKVDIQADAQARNQSGNPLTPQEHEALRTKMMQCNKVLAESNSFMEKFKDQQNQFRASAQQRYDTQNQANTAHGDNSNQAEPSMPPGQPTPQSAPPAGGPPGGPQAHSISSAVSAARHRATSAAANQPASTSPTISQPQTSQTPSGQQTQPLQQTPQSAMSQPNQNPTQSSGPAPFSAQSALQQSAATYTTQSQPQSATHAHPSQNAAAGFMNPGKKEERPNIPKNLNVTAPRPVSMPPSRPTLNGGPGVGMPGQMGEPAIPVMPGYVLETSEDGRVLSRKKLNELAREVCGPGEDEKLTPEAEDVSVNPFIRMLFLLLGECIIHTHTHTHTQRERERERTAQKTNPTPTLSFSKLYILHSDSHFPFLSTLQIMLNVTDDFVDEVITSACKVAKLRGSSALELRDVQLVLERQWNIRVPGFSGDEVRTVRRQGGTVAWQQKSLAVQAAKLMGGAGAGAENGGGGGGGKDGAVGVGANTAAAAAGGKQRVEK